MSHEDLLGKHRKSEKNPLPQLLQQPIHSCVKPEDCDHIRMFIVPGEQVVPTQPLRVGVVLSGGQAAGGHNVIIGLYDCLKKLNPESQLFGFLNGPSGILKGKYIELQSDLLDAYRNTGGFDMIGSGRTKIETPEQFAEAKRTIESLQLNGLVVIGGDDSNTNAALLSDYLKQHLCDCSVVGAPKTIDGDLRSADVEISFGFDTACKTFSETIGNIARDTLSAKKYYHFIKLMGRSASHITLECALQTHPNIALIGEEIARDRTTLRQVTEQVVDIICKRAELDKNYGVVLIPEGILEFIPECQKLIQELNGLLASGKDPVEVLSLLSTSSKACFEAMPEGIRNQLLMDRDPHGNVQVSKIETERLFIASVEEELQRRHYKGKFSAQPHFLGYEGRSCFPSHFDANYCYALGFVCALLVNAKATGFMAFIKGLTQPVSQWEGGGIALTSLMHLEERKGQQKPVIRKALVELDGPAFEKFAVQRQDWALNDDYCFPGPIQFFGPEEMTHQGPRSLQPRKCRVAL